MVRRKFFAVSNDRIVKRRNWLVERSAGLVHFFCEDRVRGIRRRAFNGAPPEGGGRGTEEMDRY